MVGRVGYAPTTPAMSMQYSTIELTAPQFSLFSNILVFSLTAYIKDKLSIKKVILKSLKKAPLGINGKKFTNKYTKVPI
tara:strand:- start:37 stop:273 length:237 start_codon:yes stop_codon:yes gene_type:complete